MAEQALAPTGFESFLVPTVEKVEQNTLPYLQFYSARTPKASEIATDVRGVKEPEPIVYYAGRYHRASPLKFHILRSKILYVKRDSQGNAVDVSIDDPEERGFNQEIHAVLLVYTPDGLVPVTARFSSGGCKGMVKPSNELASMAGPNAGQFMSEWAARSPEHKVASGFKVPFTRFTTTLSMKLQVSKTSGNPYRLSESFSEPTSLADMKVLTEFEKNKDKTAEMNAVAALFQSRIDALVKMAG